MLKPALLALPGVIALFFTNVQAATPAATLHQQSCTSCHGSEVYTRPNHRIQGKPQLVKQVRRCTLAAGAKWFDDEIQAVADYLDKHYYHFSK